MTIAVGITVACSQEMSGVVVDTGTLALPAGNVATVGFLASLSDESEGGEPPFALYGYVDIDGEREYLFLASCDDVDVEDSLPEGIADPFLCDDLRYIAQLEGLRLDFLAEGSEEPVASALLPQAVQMVNGLPVMQPAEQAVPDVPQSLGRALIDSRSQ